MKKASLLPFSFVLISLFTTNIAVANTNVSKVYKVAHVKSAGALHLRSGPSVMSNVKLELPYDARWIVLRDAQTNNLWKKVNWNEEEGWVNSQYLQYDPEATAILQARRQCVTSKQRSPTLCCGYPKQRNRNGAFYPVKVFNVHHVEAGQSLNMRYKPGAQNGVVATIPHNAVNIVRLHNNAVTIKGDKWNKVRWNGRNGWVNANFIYYDSELTKSKNRIRKICSQ